MFSKVFALFALFALAAAAPKPAPAPAPAPQILTYSTGIDYVYPETAAIAPALSPYAPLTYSAYPAAYAAYYR